MERYLLFKYWDYYPSGGAGDLVGAFDTLGEAKAYLEDLHSETENADILRVNPLPVELVLIWDRGWREPDKDTYGYHRLETMPQPSNEI